MYRAGMNLIKIAAVAIGFGCGLVPSANAAVLLVDFTDTANPGLILPGFVGQSNVDHTYSLPGGVSVAVDLPTAAPGFDQIATRASSPVLSSGSTYIPDGTNIDALQRDFYVHGGGGDGTFLTITLNGLVAGTYHFELWFSDLNVGGNIVQQRVDLSTNGGGSYTTLGNPPAHGVQATPFGFNYTANGADSVIIKLIEDHPTFEQVRLNGFGAEYAVPEPASLGLLAVFGAAAMLRRNNRKK